MTHYSQVGNKYYFLKQITTDLTSLTLPTSQIGKNTEKCKNQINLIYAL